MSRRHPQDRGGAWFADTTCIACDVARLLAPGLIAEDARGLSYFTREPATEEERRQAWRAMLACPSASIGGPKPPADVFPWELTPGVWMLGHDAAKPRLGPRCAAGTTRATRSAPRAGSCDGLRGT